jgi:hypothetical protein
MELLFAFQGLEINRLEMRTEELAVVLYRNRAMSIMTAQHKISELLIESSLFGFY